MRDQNLWETYPDKSGFLKSFFKDVSTRAAKKMDSDSGSARDKIFDYLMLQFDELEPYKKFIRILRHDTASWPLLLGVLCRSSVSWINDLDLQQSSKLRCAWVLALCGIYPYGLWLWLHDNSGDHAKLMAAIDRALMRIDMILQQITAMKSKV